MSHHEAHEWSGAEDSSYHHIDRSEACVEYGTCHHGHHYDLMRDAIFKDLMRDAIVKNDNMRDAVVKNDNMRDAIVKNLMRDAIVKDDEYGVHHYGHHDYQADSDSEHNGSYSDTDEHHE